MRLIDADELCDDVDNYEFTEHSDYSNVRDMIDYAPTIDAEPVKHGRWETGTFYRRCTACGADYDSEKEPPYCEMCGAKMDGDTDDET